MGDWALLLTQTNPNIHTQTRKGRGRHMSAGPFHGVPYLPYAEAGPGQAGRAANSVLKTHRSRSSHEGRLPPTGANTDADADCREAQGDINCSNKKKV